MNNPALSLCDAYSLLQSNNKGDGHVDDWILTYAFSFTSARVARGFLGDQLDGHVPSAKVPGCYRQDQVEIVLYTSCEILALAQPLLLLFIQKYNGTCYEHYLPNLL